MRNILTTLGLVLFSAFTVFGQTLPDNPDPNKCYVRCVTPDVYETEEVRVMVRPAYKKMKVVPAVYETREEEVVIKEGYTRYEVIAAEFTTETVSYQSEQPYNKITLTEPSFSDAFDSVMVTPKVARWEYTPYEGCKSDDPADCQVLCFREYPAQFTAVPKKVLANDAGMNKAQEGGQSSTYTKQVVSRAAEVREIKIEPETRVITKRVLVSDERVEEETVEPEYTTVTREVLKQKGGLAVWEEIECELTTYNVLPINYELGSARLTSESRNIIDSRLVKLMKDRPNIRIEIGAHTDSRGSKESNQTLSERRAQSVVNYLIAKGINSSRLVARGFGESRLKNRCADGIPCTEKEHAANRRTEFRILNTDF